MYVFWLRGDTCKGGNSDKMFLKCSKRKETPPGKQILSFYSSPHLQVDLEYRKANIKPQNCLPSNKMAGNLPSVSIAFKYYNTQRQLSRFLRNANLIDAYLNMKFWLNVHCTKTESFNMRRKKSNIVSSYCICAIKILHNLCTGLLFFRLMLSRFRGPSNLIIEISSLVFIKCGL